MLKTYKVVECYHNITEINIFYIKAFNSDHFFKELYKYYSKILKSENMKMDLQALEGFILEDINFVHCVEDNETLYNDSSEELLMIWEDYVVYLRNNFETFNF